VAGGSGDPATGDDAHLVDAAVDVHQDDPEFGHRFITDQLPARGITAGRTRVGRLCSAPALVGARPQAWPARA
jgi:hypothetical protein